MKVLNIRRAMDAFQDIEIIIKDEEKFKQLCENHLKEGNTLNFWDLEDSTIFPEDVVEIKFGYIDWEEEEFLNFEEEMEDNGFPWDDEEYLEVSE